MLDALSLLLVLYFVYMAPTMIAVARCRPNAAIIFAANVFLGWTVVGWIAVFVWALKRENISRQNATHFNQLRNRFLFALAEFRKIRRKRDRLCFFDYGLALFERPIACWERLR